MSAWSERHLHGRLRMQARAKRERDSANRQRWGAAVEYKVGDAGTFLDEWLRMSGANVSPIGRNHQAMQARAKHQA